MAYTSSYDECILCILSLDLVHTLLTQQFAFFIRKSNTICSFSWKEVIGGTSGPGCLGTKVGASLWLSERERLDMYQYAFSLRWPIKQHFRYLLWTWNLSVFIHANILKSYDFMCNYKIGSKWVPKKKQLVSNQFYYYLPANIKKSDHASVSLGLSECILLDKVAIS